MARNLHNDPDDPYIDPPCLFLAQYMQEKLNSEHPELTVVQSIRCYDAHNVPYTDYPILKVYRMSDDGDFSQNFANTQFVMSYGLVLPELENLSPILSWVRTKMVKHIAAYNINCAGEYPRVDRRYRSEYRTMLNELTNKVHMFLRLSGQFTY